MIETMPATRDTAPPTQGPWNWTTFCKPSGDPILTVDDVAETIAGSAHHSPSADLYGVTLNDAALNEDGKATVVCYTGNGPNAHNNARVIAAVPLLVGFLRHLLDRDHGFVYSRDRSDAAALLTFIERGEIGPLSFVERREIPMPDMSQGEGRASELAGLLIELSSDSDPYWSKILYESSQLLLAAVGEA